jgi:intein/homing endonuclease
MQFGGLAIEVCHTRQYNCSFTHIDRFEAFSQSLYLLLCGCGVGYSVQYEHVDKLPPIGRVDEKKFQHHVIADTIEGWGDAVTALFQAFQDGVSIEFAYHQIRPAGSTLKTSGGRAPGHAQLKKSLEGVRGVLLGAQGRQLRPIEAHRVMCMLADAPLSGGIRRSAMVALFSPDDSEMRDCKTGDWFLKEGYFKNANNSAVYLRNEASKKLFMRNMEATKAWGDPGFYFTWDLDYGANPCFHPDTRLWTSDGYVKVGDLYGHGQPLQIVVDRRPGKGDEVSGVKGVVERPASAVKLTQRNAKVYELVTEHGYTMRVTGNHKFPTPEGRRELQDLDIGDILFLPSGEGSFGQWGSYDEGLILGMYVGNGTTTWNEGKEEAFVDVWEQDFNLLDDVLKAVNGIIKDVPTFHEKRDYGDVKWHDGTPSSEGGVEKKRTGGVRLFRWMQTVADGEDVSILKSRVPEKVWRGSRNFVLGYLRGLFITDGFVLLGGSGSGMTLSLRLNQSNEASLKDVQVLLSMFGVVSRVYPRAEEGMYELPDGQGGRKEYFCEANFELVISRPNVITFRDRIGLIGWKKDTTDHYLKIRGEKCRKPERFITRVKEIKAAGRSDVYCLTQPDTNVVTANGVVTGQCVEIGLHPILTVDDVIQARLAKKGIFVEIGSRWSGFAFCNLTTINAAKFKTADDFMSAARAATFIGTLQASYTDFPYLGRVSEAIAERDALLGVSITGMLDAPKISCDPNIQRSVARRVKEWNREFAELIGIEPAARTTCVKPEGTASLELGGVATGQHGHHAKRYFKRVIANEHEFIFQEFKKVNPHMCVRKPDGEWVIEFPVEAPPGAILKGDLGAVEFLRMGLSTQKNWVVPGLADDRYSPRLHHNVSITVQVREDEWSPVAEFIWANREHFTGVSLFAATGDKDFAFAPNEEVLTESDEARWADLVGRYMPVNYTAMIEAEDGTDLKGEVACAGGACLV